MGISRETTHCIPSTPINSVLGHCQESYRRARGLDFALKQIESEAGTLLDAEVVRVCVSLFRNKRLVIPGLEWN